MHHLAAQIVLRFEAMTLLIITILFLPARTVRWWQGWSFRWRRMQLLRGPVDRRPCKLSGTKAEGNLLLVTPEEVLKCCDENPSASSLPLASHLPFSSSRPRHRARPSTGCNKKPTSIDPLHPCSCAGCSRFGQACLSSHRRHPQRRCPCWATSGHRTLPSDDSAVRQSRDHPRRACDLFPA